MSRTSTTRPEKTVYPVPIPPSMSGTYGLAEIAAVLGGTLLIAASPKGRRGMVTRFAGAALLGYAARPAIVRQVRDTGARRRTLASAASIEIARPTADVFGFFKDFECFPRVMGALRSVIDYRDGRSHWEMYSPSGRIIAWDVVVTKYVPNSVIAWESVRGSEIQMVGIVRFIPHGPESTQVNLELVYRPAFTDFTDAVHAIARRASQDPLYDVLERARFYVESLPSSNRDAAPTE